MWCLIHKTNFQFIAQQTIQLKTNEKWFRMHKHIRIVPYLTINDWAYKRKATHIHIICIHWENFIFEYTTQKVNIQRARLKIYMKDNCAIWIHSPRNIHNLVYFLFTRLDRMHNCENRYYGVTIVYLTCKARTPEHAFKCVCECLVSVV